VVTGSLHCPRCDEHYPIVDSIPNLLPPEASGQSGLALPKDKTRGITEPPANKSRLMRQLANQLTTVFIVALLCLWLAATRSEVIVHVERPVWWYFVILSACALFLWLFVGRKRTITPRRRWGFFCVALGFIWSYYGISWISFGSGFFKWLAIFLLIWMAFLLLTLGLITTRRGIEGKLGKAITWVVMQGDYFYWPLSVLVVFASIFLGWKMLWDTGMRGWWMTPLLCLGILLFFVVWLVYLFTNHSRSNRD